MKMNSESKYLTKAKETYFFHKSKLLSNDKWTMNQTARSLRRSLGGISEDLIIARFCKEHEDELKKFDYAYEALEYIRKRKKEADLE